MVRDWGMSLVYKQMAPDKKLQRALSVLLRPEACLAEVIRGKQELNILDFGCGRLVFYAAAFIDFFTAVGAGRKINLVLVDAEEARIALRAMSVINQARARCVVVGNLSVMDNADVNELRRRCGIEKFDIITMLNPNAPPFVSRQLLVEGAEKELNLIKHWDELVARGISPDKLGDRDNEKSRELLAGWTLTPIKEAFVELLAQYSLLLIAAASDSLAFGEIRAALKNTGYTIRIDAPNSEEEDPSETFYRHLFVASLNPNRSSTQDKDKI